jgi:hypothetical protein
MNRLAWMFAAILMFTALAAPCFAQVGSAFVKGDPAQCWLDVKEIVHRHADVVAEYEKEKALKANHISLLSDDYEATIQVFKDTVKGEVGCRITALVHQGGMVLSNTTNLPVNNRAADQIAGEVKKLMKERK